MHVIATAGHVDHGKSTLLRALTGMEPDRWEEERRRGLTIDIGFVWTTLPGGAQVAFVDVPGHEKFITNMLAGVGPVPAVLFVVAADGGWQAQSQEHLEVLDAFGIEQGLLAVTRADLADPTETLGAARRAMSPTSLRDIAAVAVSARTGAGFDDLRAALIRLTIALPEPDPTADVRLWVDRAFTVTGRGVVVTGTLSAGTVRTGDELTVAGSSESVRVRGVQALRRDQEKVAGTARVALNLRGRAAERLARGDALVTPGCWFDTSVFDVALSGGVPVPPPREAIFHLGAAAVSVRVRALGQHQDQPNRQAGRGIETWAESGRSGTVTARLTARRPLPLRPGDRALMRDPGSRRVHGAVVLDVRPPPLRRRGAAARRAEMLLQMTGALDGPAEVRRRGLVRARDLRAMGLEFPSAPVAEGWFADPDHWQALQDRLVEVVEARADTHPGHPGLSLETVRKLLDLPDRALVTALADGLAEIHRARGRLVVARAVPRLSEHHQAAVDAVRTDLVRAPFRAPDAERLTKAGLDGHALATAEAAGLLLRVGPGIVLLPDAEEHAVRLLAEIPSPFTTPQARAALDTTRRVALPLLEYLDSRGRTRRVSPTERRLIVGPRTVSDESDADREPSPRPDAE